MSTRRLLLVLGPGSGHDGVTGHNREGLVDRDENPMTCGVGEPVV